MGTMADLTVTVMATVLVPAVSAVTAMTNQAAMVLRPADTAPGSAR